MKDFYQVERPQDYPFDINNKEPEDSIFCYHNWHNLYTAMLCTREKIYKAWRDVYTFLS